MTHPHRYYLFANVLGAAWVRGLMQAMGNGGAAELEACKIALYAAGPVQTTPLYFCCSFVCTEQQRVQLEGIEARGQLHASVMYCRCDALTGRVIKTNHPAFQDRIGRIWDTNTTLADLGFAFKRSPNGP